MKLAAIVPTPAQIGREALILIAGALLAALIMRQFPSARQYVKDGWN